MGCTSAICESSRLNATAVRAYVPPKRNRCVPFCQERFWRKAPLRLLHVRVRVPPTSRLIGTMPPVLSAAAVPGTCGTAPEVLQVHQSRRKLKLDSLVTLGV